MSCYSRFQYGTSFCKEGRMGFANSQGEIVIPPVFQFAYPFKDGKARVAFKVERTKQGEHELVKSDQWFYIYPETRCK